MMTPIATIRFIAATMVLAAASLCAWSADGKDKKKEDVEAAAARKRFEKKWAEGPLPAMVSEKDSEAFRLTEYPSFTPPTMVRFVVRDGVCVMSYKQLDGYGGYWQGPLVINKQRQLSAAEWATFEKLLTEAKVWSIPKEINLSGLDGTSYVMEAAKGDKYRSIVRWEDSELQNVIEYINKLVNWKKARQTPEFEEFSSNKANLMWAAKKGDLKELKEMLNKGIPVDSRSGFQGDTALDQAAINGHLRVVKYLVKKGFDLTKTKLHPKVVETGNVEMVAYLLKHGVTVEEAHAKHHSREDALVNASIQGDPEMVALLVKEKVYSTNRRYLSEPLSQASSGGNAAVVKILLEHGAKVNEKGVCDFTPLLWAAGGNTSDEEGDSDTVATLKLLIAKGADLKAVDEYGNSALIRAARGGKTKAVNYLLQQGLTVDQVNKEGRTALHVAAAEGTLATVKLLLANKADVNRKDGAGYTPLNWAQCENRPVIADHLLEAGAKRNWSIELLSAARRGDRKWVKKCLDKGAKVNTVGHKYHGTVLINAIYKKDVALFDMIMAAKPNVNLKSGWGNTPLVTAVEMKMVNMARVLLEAGADPDLARKDGGVTPLMYAVKKDHLEMVKLLMTHGADVGRKVRSTFPIAATENPTMVKLLLSGKLKPALRRKCLNAALLRHARSGDAESVQLLLDAGANINAKDEDGRNALALAVVAGWMRRPEAAELLINKGADVNGKIDGYSNIGPCTTLEFARRTGQKELAELLRKHGAKTSEELEAKKKK